MKKLVVKTSLLLSGLIPAVAFADEGFDPLDPGSTPPPLPENTPTNFKGLIDVIVTIAQWMFGILMALSIIMILYSAFLYIFSAGSEDKIKKAKDTLMYAIIAVAVAVFAGGVGVLIKNFVSPPESTISGGGGGNPLVE